MTRAVTILTDCVIVLGIVLLVLCLWLARQVWNVYQGLATFWGWLKRDIKNLREGFKDA